MAGLGTRGDTGLASLRVERLHWRPQETPARGRAPLGPACRGLPSQGCLRVPGVVCPLLHCFPSWFPEEQVARGRTGGFSKRAGALPTWAPKGSVVTCGCCWTCDWHCVLHLTYLFLRHLGPGLGPQAHPRFRGPHSELAVTG